MQKALRQNGGFFVFSLIHSRHIKFHVHLYKQLTLHSFLDNKPASQEVLDFFKIKTLI